jgi:MYXO-CTERM domain-containing protein
MLRNEDRRHPHDWAAFVVTGDDEPMRFPAGEEPVVPEVEGPPPVDHHRGGGCNVGGTDRDLPVGTLLLGLLGLGVLRRKRRL